MMPLDFGPTRALLVGDLMLDVYTRGQVERVSPEAPVCILNVSHEESRPGGAGNAMLNLSSLGVQVRACGRVGRDQAGSLLLTTLEQAGIETDFIVCEPTYQTPRKNRLIADQQQLVRVDHEVLSVIDAQTEAKLLDALDQLLDGIDVVAISDYGKGMLSQTFLTALIERAQAHRIPSIIDPKGIDFSKYRGATLIKPNFNEAVAASGLCKTASLDAIASALFEKTGVKNVMITRSKEGISLFSSKGKRHDFPVSVHEVKDVTGAGDTVLAVVTLALGNALPLDEAAELANVAASITIEHVGCYSVSLEELKSRLAGTSLRPKSLR